MNKKLTFVSLLFIAVVVIAVVVLANNKKESLSQAVANMGPEQNTVVQKNDIILFYGDGCPHCAIVEKYLSENNVSDTIAFAQKEVYHHQDNAKELETKAKQCGIPTDSIGVPFLWDGSGCIIGDQPIIDFFKSRVGQK